jgi:CDP-paratose 2-epimerase
MIHGNLLITGGGGFIGSHTAEFFSKIDSVDQVFVIDNLSRQQLLSSKDVKKKRDRYNRDYLKNFKKVIFKQRDLRNFKFLELFFKKHDINVVIHTAAQTAVTSSLLDPKSDFENNTRVSFNILEAVRRSSSDPTMILCSTNKVFGDNVNKCKVIELESRYQFAEENFLGVSETYPIDLCEHTPYGTSKLASDLYFQDYGHVYGFKTAVFRMSCIYGTRQFGVEDQGWIAHFIISSILGKNLTIYGDGKQVRDVLYVDDLIQAFKYYIEKADKVKHDVFCIGGGIKHTLSLLELISLLEEKMGIKINYRIQDWRPSDQKVYISDIRKAKEKLGWEPKITPQEGVTSLIDWVSKNKHLF